MGVTADPSFFKNEAATVFMMGDAKHARRQDLEMGFGGEAGVTGTCRHGSSRSFWKNMMPRQQRRVASFFPHQTVRRRHRRKTQCRQKR